MKLSQRFDPHRNGLDVLRLVLAGVVALDHGVIIRTGVVHRVHGSALGDFAVDGFFVLSGFLVCRSYLRLRSLPRFLWHRAVRILPAFWVCLLVTSLVAAPLVAALEGRPVHSVLTTEPTASRYLIANAFLRIRQFDIAGLLAGHPTPAVMNGSLWTLVYEAFCYLLVGTLGAAGILARRRGLVVVATTLVWAITILQSLGLLEVGTISARLVLMFLLGSLAHLFADKLPMSVAWVVGAAVVLVVGIVWVEPYRALGAAAFAYLLIWIGCAPLAASIRTDLSYGLYIYHYLIFQILMSTALGTLPVAAFVVVGTATSLVAAAASWFAVEKRALARKNALLRVRTRSGHDGRMNVSDGTAEDGTGRTAEEVAPAGDGATMQIGVVAERLGLSGRTLHHWEEMGLVTPSARSVGGFRLYTEEDVERLILVRRMKPLGFSLEEMAEFLHALDSFHQSPDAETRDRARTVIETVRTRLGEARANLHQRLGWADEFESILDSESAATT